MVFHLIVVPAACRWLQPPQSMHRTTRLGSHSTTGFCVQRQVLAPAPKLVASGSIWEQPWHEYMAGYCIVRYRIPRSWNVARTSIRLRYPWAAALRHTLPTWPPQATCVPFISIRSSQLMMVLENISMVRETKTWDYPFSVTPMHSLTGPYVQYWRYAAV